MLTKDFLNSIIIPPPMTTEDLLFNQMVESFESGDDKEALLLCRKIMALEERRAAEAEHYLGLLEKREQWLFQKAVELFEDDDDEEAGLLFRQVIALAGANAREAKNYLELLNQRADEMLLVEAKHLLQIERYLEAHDRFKAAADLKLAHRSEAGRYMENVKTLISQKFEGQGRPDLPAFSHYEHSAGWPSVD